jgi:hypothetical protein
VSLLIKYQENFLTMNSEDEKTPVREPIIDISTLSSTQSKLDIPTQSKLDIPTQTPDLRDRQETTRAWLATFLTYTLAGTITTSFILIISLVVMSGFIVDEKKNSSFDKTSALAKDLITFILTAQTGLIGTALGFYFGSKGNSD